MAVIKQEKEQRLTPLQVQHTTEDYAVYSASAATILLGIILVFVIVYVYISNRMVGDQSARGT